MLRRWMLCLPYLIGFDSERTAVKLGTAAVKREVSDVISVAEGRDSVRARDEDALTAHPGLLCRISAFLFHRVRVRWHSSGREKYSWVLRQPCECHARHLCFPVDEACRPFAVPKSRPVLKSQRYACHCSQHDLSGQ
jgi:hypothetical protein